MLGKGIGLVVILAIAASITPIITPVFALTELERTSIINPRLENSFGTPIFDNVNVSQKVQISADIINHQTKLQNFVYIVQIKDDNELVASLSWFSAQLTPDQKLRLSLSWTPEELGEYSAEIFVWENLSNHNALSEHTKLQINVS